MPQPKTLSAELPQTGTFEGRSTDLAIAPWQEIERQKKKKKSPVPGGIHTLALMNTSRVAREGKTKEKPSRFRTHKLMNTS